jgi:hypothetical protein
VPAARVVPTLDVGEQRQPRLGLGLPAAAVDQFALQAGEEALVWAPAAARAASARRRRSGGCPACSGAGSRRPRCGRGVGRSPRPAAGAIRCAGTRRARASKLSARGAARIGPAARRPADRADVGCASRTRCAPEGNRSASGRRRPRYEALHHHRSFPRRPVCRSKTFRCAD